MSTFKCTICGDEHKIVRAVDAPGAVLISNMSESERTQRVKKIQDSFIIDDKLFLLKGDIFIYSVDEQEPFFTWSVWVSIGLEDFKAQAEELNKRNNVEFIGRLESQLPFYEKSLGLKIKTIINLNYNYAVIKIMEDSPIKEDQVNKITKTRGIELMSKMHHKGAEGKK